MSLMIRIRHNARHDFYTLVLNPCQLDIEPLAKPLADLLILGDQSHRMEIVGPDSVCLPATNADSLHVSLFMILLLAKDLSLNRGKRLDQTFGAFTETKAQFPSSTFGSIGLGAYAKQWVKTS